MTATYHPPTIVFDGAVLAAGPITGVAGSFLTTLRAYAATRTARCVLSVPRGVDLPALDDVEVVEGPFGRLARQRVLPRLLRQLSATLLHCPVAALPLRGPCPMLATVHDLPWMARFPLHETGCGPTHRLAVRLAAHLAAAIVVPTRATARDLIRFVGPRVESRVHVVPHGVGTVTEPAPEVQLTGPLLVLGDDRPRKNLARVREAHELARSTCPDLPDLQLVGPGFGYVSEHRKVELLRHARAVMQLSLHEGFGLPILEALAHGVPVLCADIPSLREVAAGAALLANPVQVDSMASAMIRIHLDRALRRQLRARGLARAAALEPGDSAAAWHRIHTDLLAANRRARA